MPFGVVIASAAVVVWLLRRILNCMDASERRRHAARRGFDVRPSEPPKPQSEGKG